jgi:UDP-2-acetamido-2,6-beta-L-arabino-hexul-4-ose reductase
MKVLITGADGFIGKNLRQHLTERPDVEVATFTRADTPEDLPRLVAGTDFVFHLAGVNRPQDPQEFLTGNRDLTIALLRALEEGVHGRRVPVVLASSIHAAHDNPYGASKRAAEQAVAGYAARSNSPAHLFRLPNVFGKWCRPNYNSAVATFCHNIARDLTITIHDPSAELRLVHVDDVVSSFLRLLDDGSAVVDAEGFATVEPVYTATVGEVARLVEGFRGSRDTLMADRAGAGFVRALYSTYLSYLPPGSFSYRVARHGDPRGVFVEMLKTPDCGQFSYFTAHPGVTRGGHYHHAKTEKFLVIQGRARFKFRHVQTNETYELVTTGEEAEIVETVPGWAHDVTNIGDNDLVVMLWANEVFDRSRPDTIACRV